jgi:hypothetical protein
MRKKSMVAEGNRKAASSQHGKEEKDLKSIKAKDPKIRWHSRD